MGSKKIVLTGGGTAGHVTPNMALIPRLKELDYEIVYIGSYDGIEKKLIEDFDIPYYGIATGKFRRYFDPKNFSDPFRVIKGMGEARKYLKEISQFKAHKLSLICRCEDLQERTGSFLKRQRCKLNRKWSG